MVTRSDLHLLVYLVRQKQKSFWYARHNAISTKAWFRTNLRASIKLITGTSKNSMEDFTILYKICVFGNHPVSPNITQVRLKWILMALLKVHRGMGFIKGIFSYYFGISFAFEAELMGFIFAIETAYN